MADRIQIQGDALAWLGGQGGEMERALAALVGENSFTANPLGGNRTGALLRELFAARELHCTV
ncbi:MAG TPA: hypothetical protein VJT73_02725, partial [Polyangiaceae bacterium]|nr:hypothetical protein [Polyangiaceae bacterium]